MKRCLVILTALLILLSFTGCRGKPKVLLDTDLLKVEQEGSKISVYDVLGDNVYNFRIVHKKPSNRVLEAYAAVDTPTLRIEKQFKKLLLTVKKSKEVFTIRINRIFPKISLFKGGNK